MNLFTPQHTPLRTRRLLGMFLFGDCCEMRRRRIVQVPLRVRVLGPSFVIKMITTLSSLQDIVLMHITSMHSSQLFTQCHHPCTSCCVHRIHQYTMLFSSQDAL